jgi:hypothetical protein
MRGRFVLAVAVAGVTAAASLVIGAGEPKQIVLTSGAQAGSSATLAGLGLTEVGDAIRFARQARAFERDLNAISRSDDPVGKLLERATCQGLSQVADQNRRDDDAVPPSAREWQRFLNAQAGYLGPRYAGRISSRVSQADNTLQLATINPRAAYAYVKVCVRRAP